jgi:endonuclease YncB( thermonuclease family)
MLKLFAMSALSVVLNLSIAQASSVRVVDGDTLEIGETSYRLHGIDAPEAGQTCSRQGGGQWPCGKQAIAYMKALISGGSIRCEGNVADNYNRIIAICYNDSRDLNQAMVDAGLAWAFVKYSSDYLENEKIAKALKIGIWQQDTQTPWDYRSQKWNVANQDTPSGCPIKGNISKGGKIYHAPWSPWYAKTKVSLSKGERWFCNEAEAVEAGWRAPVWGD